MKQTNKLTEKEQLRKEAVDFSRTARGQLMLGLALTTTARLFTSHPDSRKQKFSDAKDMLCLARLFEGYIIDGLEKEMDGVVMGEAFNQEEVAS